MLYILASTVCAGMSHTRRLTLCFDYLYHFSSFYFVSVLNLEGVQNRRDVWARKNNLIKIRAL